MPTLNQRTQSGSIAAPESLIGQSVVADSYVRPAQRSSSSENLSALAEALSGLSPSVMKAGAYFADQQKTEAQQKAQDAFNAGKTREEVAKMDPYGWAASQYDSLRGDADHIRYMNRAVQAVRESPLMGKDSVTPEDLAKVTDPIKQELLQAAKSSGAGAEWSKAFQAGTNETDHNLTYMLANNAVANWQKNTQEDWAYATGSDIRNSLDVPDSMVSVPDLSKPPDHNSSDPNPIAQQPTKLVPHTQFLAESIQNAALERAKKIFGDTPDAKRQANAMVAKEMSDALVATAWDENTYTKFPQLMETWKAMSGGTGPLSGQYKDIMTEAMKQWHYAEGARHDAQKETDKQNRDDFQVKMFSLTAGLDPKILQSTPSAPADYVTSGLKMGIPLGEIKSLWETARSSVLEPTKAQSEDGLKELDYIIADPQGRNSSGMPTSKSDAMRMLFGMKGSITEPQFREKVDQINKNWSTSDPEMNRAESELGVNLKAAFKPISEESIKNFQQMLKGPDGKTDPAVAAALSKTTPTWVKNTLESGGDTNEYHLVDVPKYESPIDTVDLERQASTNATLWLRQAINTYSEQSPNRSPSERAAAISGLQVQATEKAKAEYVGLLKQASKSALPDIQKSVEDQRQFIKEGAKVSAMVSDPGTPKQRLTLAGAVKLQSTIGGSLDRMNWRDRTGLVPRLGGTFRALGSFTDDQSKVDEYQGVIDTLSSGKWGTFAMDPLTNVSWAPKDMEQYIKDKAIPGLETIIRSHQFDAASFLSTDSYGNNVFTSGGVVGGNGVSWGNEVWGSPTAASAAVYKNAVLALKKIRETVPTPVASTLQEDPGMLDWRTMPLMTKEELTPENMKAVAKHLGIESPRGQEDFALTQKKLVNLKSPSSDTPIDGLVTAGNIDLHNRPVVKNSDGSISTVRSITVDSDGKFILIPTVSDSGSILSNKAAIDLYKSTGKHLGVFKSEATADSYAKKLHEQQAAEYSPTPWMNLVNKTPNK